ncbi:MAG: hypothetical protein KBC73_05535 [Burkholderiaceae bacterium]|nr:hypothetical protein [Burkholderiaceae bacterium]
MVLGETILKAGAAAAAGMLVGWAGSALTLAGRVDAIERTLQRIESRMDDAVLAATARAAQAAVQEPRK